MTDLIVSRSNGASPFDAIRHFEDGVEFWVARELMRVLGYQAWHKFKPVVENAQDNIESLGLPPSEHFFPVELKNTDEQGNPLRGRPGLDYHLSRLACYHVALSCDSRGNPRVKAAKHYFAVAARENELRNQSQTSLPPVAIEDIGAAVSIMAKLFGERYGQRAFKVNMTRHYPQIALPDPEESELAPYAEAHATPTATDIARSLDLYNGKGNPCPRKANLLLEQFGYQQRINGKWTPTGEGLEHSLRKVVDVGGRTDKDQLVWFPSIIDELKASL